MNMITIDTGEAVETARKVEFQPYDLYGEDIPLLKQKIPEFNFNDKTLDPVEISERLKATLTKHKAYGIAAPQCNLNYRVFVMGYDGEYITLFNPEIIHTSEEGIHMEEGCLSFPFLTLSITRSKVVRIRYQTVDGEKKEIAFDGLSARVAQHEIDHLNGITFDTLAKPLALKSGRKKREKYLKRFVRNMVLNKQVNV